MRFDLITIFPHIFDSYINESILRRAQEQKLISVVTTDIRLFSHDRHNKVDQRPYGGGPGMVLQAEPIARAVLSVAQKKRKPLVVITSAGGKPFDAKIAMKFSKEKQIIFVAGHYEGVDERVKKILKQEGIRVVECSIGNYVLTGGELPALVMIDATIRHIPGVLGKEESIEESRHGVGVPSYTRPESILWKKKKHSVPKVLVSGNHGLIDAWRKKNKK